ncbi:MAG TPA: phage tail tube protein [Candidatus Angelobacter sp.]|jgi:hypothetical protein
MTTQAQIGYGSSLNRGNGDGPPETFTAIPELTDLKGPGIKIDIKDVSNMQSPQFFKEKIAGLIDAGQITASMNWIPGNAQQKALLADAFARVTRNFQYLVPGGLKWSFAAIVSAFDPGTPVGDNCVASVTLDITGPTTLA